MDYGNVHTIFYPYIELLAVTCRLFFLFICKFLAKCDRNDLSCDKMYELFWG